MIQLLRFFLAPVIGLLALAATVWLIESVRHQIFPPNPELVEQLKVIHAAPVTDWDGVLAVRAKVSAIVATVPPQTFLPVVIA
ncbi:MAG: hypothetical protein O2800_07220 [Planctomycetota bacterium]|nr:hypothetical protein [Planctomycetota bacterium]